MEVYLVQAITPMMHDMLMRLTARRGHYAYGGDR